MNGLIPPIKSTNFIQNQIKILGFITSLLGGAKIVMFGNVAVAGIKILSTVNMNRRNMLILAVSFGMGLGVLLVPQFAGALATNIGGTFGKLMGSIFSSAITTGGITVLIMIDSGSGHHLFHPA